MIFSLRDNILFLLNATSIAILYPTLASQQWKDILIAIKKSIHKIE